MKIADMNWMQVEERLSKDKRAVVPMGSIEQHGYLCLAVDAILAERVACEAAEPLGVPVFPALSYGITPYFRRFPGSISLRLETYQRIVADILDSLAGTGFTRILFVNGHGGNSPGGSILQEWMNDHPGVTVKWHNWWNAAKRRRRRRPSIQWGRMDRGWKTFLGQECMASRRRTVRSR